MMFDDYGMNPIEFVAVVCSTLESKANIGSFNSCELLLADSVDEMKMGKEARTVE